MSYITGWVIHAHQLTQSILRTAQGKQIPTGLRFPGLILARK